MGAKIKVILLGVGSLRNYGCEGIVQGTYAMFREFWPECELIVATDDPQADKKMFEGCTNIRFVKEGKRFAFYRLWKGILRRFFKVGKGSPVRMNTNLVKGNQIFLSCGGDNFCEAPDGSLYNTLLDLIDAGEVAVRNKIISVLWGASVGPFNKKNELIVLKSLNQMNLIFTRERLAHNYVLSLNIPTSKVRLIADPAFCMNLDSGYVIPKDTDDIIIGLNLSPLAFEEESFPVFESLFSLSENIKIVCIPHVMSLVGGTQDDYSFLMKFIQYSKHKGRITLLPSDLGAKKTKGAISQCDLLIAARMHACVAGASAATPTLFLTYSNKGVGMSEYVYGHKKWAISNKNNENKVLLTKVTDMLKEKDAIRVYLRNNVDRFRADASKAVIELKKTYLNFLDVK